METGAEMSHRYYTDEQLAIFSSMPLFQLLGTIDNITSAPDINSRLDIYESWISNNQDDPNIYMAYFNYGSGLSSVNRLDDARRNLEAAVRSKADFLPTYINIGFVYERLGMSEVAIESWMTVVNKLTSITQENINFKLMALKQIGRLRESRAELALSEDILHRSIETDPTQRDVLQHWVVTRQRQCKWPAVRPFSNCTSETILKTMAPVSLAAYSDDPLLQLGCAYAYNRHDVGWPQKFHTAGPWVAPETPRNGRLRIGYLSSDYRHHAIGFLMAQVFELHDRAAIEVFVYYCGPHAPDFVQLRIMGTVDHWIDVNGMSNEQAASRIVGDGIDILVDINGYTNFARTNMLALRPAPIIVNWLGYPGTMGSPYHNYILADAHIIPEAYELFYSERVMRLPCYQPNDRKRETPPPNVTRAELGLPEQATVYCCFNGLQKVTPTVFRCWMTILDYVPNSVLWLLVDAPQDRERLQSLAAEAGVAPDRLHFVRWASNTDHLARYHLADVILDTWPYGAHTTASDALWMGVPVVTLSGRSFASRVCGSLAKAAGIGDLVCETPRDYMITAINLGQSPAMVSHYKEYLTFHRNTCTLFDTEKLVHHLEGLYADMWNEFQTGKLHQPKLTNLEIYQDIGSYLHQNDVDHLEIHEYLDLYRRQLAYRHSFSPIPSDGRLWAAP